MRHNLLSKRHCVLIMCLASLGALWEIENEVNMPLTLRSPKTHTYEHQRNNASDAQGNVEVAVQWPVV